MSASSRSPEPVEERPFNRERFLLRLVALVLIAEVSLYSFGAGVCAWRSAQQLVPQGGLCTRFDNAIHAAFGVALNTLLALLGGKALSDSNRPPGP